MPSCSRLRIASVGRALFFRHENSPLKFFCKQPMKHVLLPVIALTVMSGTAESRLVRTSPRVFTIRMIHDSTGQHFYPSELDVFRGDTLRFVNGVGHHNVNFPEDSNPSGVRLPPKTAVAERPGETFTIPVTMPTGRYFFQCDPHLKMGMVGELVVLRQGRVRS